MLPDWVKKMIDYRDIGSLNKLASHSKNSIEMLWARYGLGECWRLGDWKFDANKKTAYADFEKILQDKDAPHLLKSYAMLGQAECLRVGGTDFKANIKKAYDLYEHLLRDYTLPNDLRFRAMCSKADCLSRGRKDFSSQKNEAFNISNYLLNMRRYLPPIIEVRALICKARCFSIKDTPLLIYPKELYELIQEIKMSFQSLTHLEQEQFPSLFQWLSYLEAECWLLKDVDFSPKPSEARNLCDDLLDTENLPRGLRLRAFCCYQRAYKERIIDVSHMQTISSFTYIDTVLSAASSTRDAVVKSPVSTLKASQSTPTLPKAPRRKYFDSSDSEADLSSRSPSQKSPSQKFKKQKLNTETTPTKIQKSQYFRQPHSIPSVTTPITAYFKR
jgi:hypothetical protein